jgi:hypothetical protein
MSHKKQNDLDVLGYSTHCANLSKDTYGQQIEAQGQFTYQGYVISFSTKKNMCRNSVLVSNKSHDDVFDCGTVEEAIAWILFETDLINVDM